MAGLRALSWPRGTRATSIGRTRSRRPPSPTSCYPAGDPRAGGLADSCELDNSCGGPGDEDAFKGVFVRALRTLNDQEAALGRSTHGWKRFFVHQVTSVEANDRSAWTEYGLPLGGPIGLASGDTYATQASALDAFNAAAGL